MIAKLIIGSEEQPNADVYVNIAVPCDTPVMTPVVALTVAIELLLLTQTPPEGFAVVAIVLSIQIGPDPTSDTTGLGLIVPVMESELQPVAVRLKMNLTVPADIPDTRPALFTVAMAAFELVHVPPVVGDNWLVKPAQIVEGPVKDTAGGVLTVTGDELSEIQPLASVNVNRALPGPTAVTTPVLASMVATEGFKAVHVPALTGETASVVVAATHIWVAPVILTTGLLFIVTAAVGNDTQPETDDVKVNVAVPTATPVTSPALLTVAIEKLLVAHEPACEGATVTAVVKPGQIDVGLFKVAVGLASTVMVKVLVHPVPLSIKVITEVPADTPVTVLPLTVATPGVPLDHVPPEEGVNVVVAPTHMVEAFAKTVGRGFTFIFPVVLLQPVEESVNVKLVVP